MSPPLLVIIDSLADAFPAIAVTATNLHAKISAFESKWMENIRREKHDRAVDARLLADNPRLGSGFAKPGDDSKFVNAILIDALDVIGVARPLSFNWIKGLPRGRDPRVSALVDFAIERCVWDATLEVQKREAYAAYLTWLATAKSADPRKYGGEPLTMKAFAVEINKSLWAADGRPHEKGKTRQRTWKGLGLASASSEPAGQKAARVTAKFVEGLRRAFPAPSA